mmetsp:Transcript_4066/g.18493  ORF Transcript_4066/g.18493 Transcript_4066/m.18493 type:complete len:252 (-) Transcript_4066:794-1549(-)
MLSRGGRLDLGELGQRGGSRLLLPPPRLLLQRRELGRLYSRRDVLRLERLLELFGSVPGSLRGGGFLLFLLLLVPGVEREGLLRLHQRRASAQPALLTAHLLLLEHLLVPRLEDVPRDVVCAKLLRELGSLHLSLERQILLHPLLADGLWLVPVPHLERERLGHGRRLAPHDDARPGQPVAVTLAGAEVVDAAGPARPRRHRAPGPGRGDSLGADDGRDGTRGVHGIARRVDLLTGRDGLTGGPCRSGRLG